MPHSQFIQQEIVWIETDAQLKACCEKWSQCKLLSIDTEFMRSRTYFPIAGLFQVNDAQANYLIDPTCIDDFSPLKSLMENTSVVKVLHSCSEDLEVFHRVLGVLPNNLLDTQTAAAMLGYGFSVGFGNLCKAMFGTELPKSETRSNWLQRPLSNAQLQYAAIDVEYLTHIAVRLIKELQESGRLAWAKEECEKLIQAFTETQNPNYAWQRNKSAWKLSSRELHCFQQLSYWREEKARVRDVPRNRVVKDHALLDIAQNPPADLQALKGFEGMTERMLNSDGEILLQLIEASAQVSEDALPTRLPRPLSSSSKNIIKRLRDKVQGVAEELKVAPELLVRKKDYEDLVRSGVENQCWALPNALHDWRHPLVGELLLSEVTK